MLESAERTQEWMNWEFIPLDNGEHYVHYITLKKKAVLHSRALPIHHYKELQYCSTLSTCS